MNKTHHYRYIYFLTTLYATVLICSGVLGNKLIQTPIGILSAASLVSPLWYILGDIITEVYGFKIMLKLFWSAIICQFIFSFFCFLLIHLHSPAFWDGQAGYELVLGHLIKMSLFQLIGIIIAWNVNIKLLIKWKILMQGKYFWLRSIGSSGLGLIIFSIVSVFPSLFGMFPIAIVTSMVTWSCLLKIIFIIALAFPSTLIVAILKKAEKIDETQLMIQPRFHVQSI